MVEKNMVDKKLSGAGLRGQSAGETAICTVGKSGTGLTYRGYDIKQLAQDSHFEEVSYLLLKGQLPTEEELNAFQDRLITLRSLPEDLKIVLEQIPEDTHPMDVLRTGVSMLGSLEPEHDFTEQADRAERLLAIMPGIICYWYKFSHENIRIDPVTHEPQMGAHFLHLLHGVTPDPLHARVMDVSLILYAEHEFNASTFEARVCASTLSDIFSCVTSAIGTLRGPLHGGANEAAMEMLYGYDSVAKARVKIAHRLANKDKIMGFGHAVYRTCDPRNSIIKAWAKKLSEFSDNPLLYEVSEAVETMMWDEKGLFANADFFHASAYHYMNIPTKLFTPIFVCSRVSGWCAHVMEQREHNRIIRPSADYIGVAPRDYVAIEER